MQREILLTIDPALERIAVNDNDNLIRKVILTEKLENFA